MDILGINSLEELLTLQVSDISHQLTAEEILHIAKLTGAFWEYDYEAAETGKIGMHAELKSGLHSDVFFVSRILLAHKNVRRIIAAQMAMNIQKTIGTNKLHNLRMVGVPDGATKLGEDIGDILQIPIMEMTKIDGQISLVSPTYFSNWESVLLVEDFCTRGTGFIEAVNAVRRVAPEVKIQPYNSVIINRGGLEHILIGKTKFTILPIVKLRVHDWDPDSANGCPLCKGDSVPIKPKETDINWEKITTSQF